MRGAFVRALVKLAESDPRVLLLTGDLGYTALEPFAERFPDRFWNMGVAEQNMVGVATGLAEAGFLPYVYSIATFAVLRPYEFIRMGPVVHRLPVRIVGVGGGVEYGSNGISHYALEDLAVMRAQPTMTVLAPADHAQASRVITDTFDLDGPVYYRLGKDDRSQVPGLDGRFRLGRAETVRDGADVVIIAIGAISLEATRAAELLHQHGVSCRVLIVSSLNPVPRDDLATAMSDVPLALTVEAHYVDGALGSLVCEVVAEQGLRCRVVRCGFHETPDAVSGSQAFMQQLAGLNAEQLAQTAIASLEGSSRQGLPPDPKP